MATLIRINQAADGTWSVLAKDSNGVWVVADSESHGFSTRQEAQECADGWVGGGDCVLVRKVYIKTDADSQEILSDLPLQDIADAHTPTDAQLDDGAWMWCEDQETHERITVGDIP